MVLTRPCAMRKENRNGATVSERASQDGKAQVRTRRLGVSLAGARARRQATTKNAHSRKRARASHIPRGHEPYSLAKNEHQYGVKDRAASDVPGIGRPLLPNSTSGGEQDRKNP